MIMMCVTPLITVSKGRQIGAKSCKAGKLHSADKRALPDWRCKTIAASRDIDNEPIPLTSVTQRACGAMNSRRMPIPSSSGGCSRGGMQSRDGLARTDNVLDAVAGSVRNGGACARLSQSCTTKLLLLAMSLRSDKSD